MDGGNPMPDGAMRAADGVLPSPPPPRRPLSTAHQARADSLFRRYRGAVRAFLLRRTQGDAERADDLTQEVFLALISDLGSRPAESDVLAWLYTVAHRRFVDDVRRRRRQVTVAPISGVELVGPDGLEYGSAVARALLIALQQVSPIQRRVFVMKILEGRRFAEIAQTIGTSEGAARNHLLRGLRTIREMLKRYGVDP